MNQVIKKLLDDDKITQNEYDILFEDKSNWYRVEKDENQNWSISHEKQIQFWEAIGKVKEFFENMPNVYHMPAFYDFSFILFPEMLINDGCVVSPSRLLSEFSDTCLYAIFYKAIFYGKVTITNSKFKIDLDFRECEFKNVFSFVGNETKSIDFSNAIFEKKIEMRQSIFNSGVKFNKANFHNDIKFEDLHFQDNVNFSIQSGKESSFNDLICEKKASFGGAFFVGSVSFKNCEFNNFTDFTKTTFNEQVFMSNIYFYNVYFLETKFLSSVAFLFSRAEVFAMSRVIIRKITLKNTFFKDADIVDLFILHPSKKENLELTTLSKENIEDRETARTLKLIFDERGNIQDSNKLFKIEQEFYLQNLGKKDSKEPNRLQTQIVLFINRLVSNFGTDWLRALLSIIMFSYLAMGVYIIFDYHQLILSNKNDNTIKHFIDIKYQLYVIFLIFASFMAYGLTYVKYEESKKFIVLLILFILACFISAFFVTEREGLYFHNYIVQLINPVNAFKTVNLYNGIESYGMFVRIVTLALIYQFLVAFRQNTRRS